MELPDVYSEWTVGTSSLSSLDDVLRDVGRFLFGWFDQFVFFVDFTCAEERVEDAIMEEFSCGSYSRG